jgi:hypothetical protein
MIKLLKFVPQVSAAALAIMSLFHIGYFHAIGLHLLGLIDVSNIVYSFGVSMGLVAVGLGILNVDSFNVLRKCVADDDAWKLMRRVTNFFILPVGIALLLAVYSYCVFYEAPLGLTESVSAFVFTVWGACLGANIYVRSRREGQYHSAEVTGAVVFLFWATFNWGSTTALEQIRGGGSTYQIELMDHATLSQVRMLRSSSSGLIVAGSDRLVRFIPMSQIKLLRAEKPLK